MTFTKLFSSITESTVWCENSDVRIVWITMLAMANWDGVVEGSVPGLAHRARVPIEAVQEALEKFMAPDPWSRTPDHEGRRIEKVEGGWRLLNYVKHREHKDCGDQDKRRAYIRGYMREYRQKDSVNTSVNNVNTCKHPLTSVNTDTDKDRDIDKENTKSKAGALRAFVPPTFEELRAYCQERKNQVDPEKFLAYYTSQGWYVGKNRMKDWRAAVRTWERNDYGGPVMHGGYQKSKSQLKQEERDAERARVERIWREMDDADDVQGKPRPEPDF